MSYLADGYSSYLTHFHNLYDRIGTFNYAFNHVFNLAKQGIFIDCNLEERMSNYPKYPCIFRYTDKVSSYNLLKIHHVALDTVDKLMDYITSKNALEIKPNLDRIPTNLTKIRNDIYLQYTFFSNINDIFRLKQHFHDYSFLKKHVNYSYALSDPVFNESHIPHSFIHLFLFDFIFRQQLKNNVNYSNSLNVYCIDNNIFNKQSIIDEFTSFINTNKKDFLENIVNVIIQSLYKMSNSDQDLVNYIVSNISENTDLLNTAFESFMNNTTVLPSTELSQYCLNSLYLIFGTETVNSIFNNSNIFNQSYVQSIATDEDIVFNNFISKVSATNSKSYLYLSYLYKFWPIKFLNVFPLIIDKYISDIVKSENDLAYPQRNLETILKQFISESNLNYTELVNYFESTVDTNYLHILANDKNVVQFGSFIYFIKLIDDFMNSSVYEDAVNNIYQDIFIALRDKGYTEANFNWCKCKELFNLFFKSFIRFNIANRGVFKDITDDYETVFLNVINNNTGDPLYDVTITFSAAKLKSLYNSMILSHFTKIHGFVESIYLSKISYTINNNMLDYFLVDQS